MAYGGLRGGVGFSLVKMVNRYVGPGLSRLLLCRRCMIQDGQYVDIGQDAEKVSDSICFDCITSEVVEAADIFVTTALMVVVFTIFIQVILCNIKQCLFLPNMRISPNRAERSNFWLTS